MSWRDELIPASLNGVEFQVDGAGKKGGRRFTAHEFADVDGAFGEDSGRGPHRYEVKAFLVGDDYHVQLQLLEEVLDDGGVLEYDNPHRGTIYGLRLEDEYATEFSNGKLGFASVSFGLVQCEAPSPLIFESLASKMTTHAAVVFSASESMLVEKWSAQDAYGAVLRALDRGLHAIKSSYNKVRVNLGPIQDVQAQLRRFEDMRETMRTDAKSLASQFRTLTRLIDARVRKIAKHLGRSKNGYSSAGGILAENLRSTISAPQSAEAVADYDSVTSADGEIEGPALQSKIDLDALNVFAAATALASFGESLGDILLPTADDAKLLENLLKVEADAILGAQVGLEAIPSELYDAIFDLKVTGAQLLRQAKSNLPVLGFYSTPGTMPITLVAHTLADGDEDALEARISEILELNTVFDPLAVAKDTPLKVVVG